MVDPSRSSDAAVVCAGGKLNSERKTAEEMGLKHVRRQNKRHRAELHTWGAVSGSLGLAAAWRGAVGRGAMPWNSDFGLL